MDVYEVGVESERERHTHTKHTWFKSETTCVWVLRLEILINLNGFLETPI